MAILMIRIEDIRSLPLNEFFDYNNHCYALTRSRTLQEDVCIDLEDFYDASFQTEQLSGIPVIFVSEDSSSHALSLLGWYKKAEIYRKSQRKSLFMEGNVVADAADVVKLPTPQELKGFRWLTGGQLYDVIEPEDSRYPMLESLISRNLPSGSAGNAFLRYPYLLVTTDNKAMHNYEACIHYCDEFAAMIMQDECEDIRGIKALEQYASRAASLKRESADGHYYLAMAYDQLGFIRPGMKAIEKALRLEPDAPDLHGEKASLLTGMGYLTQAASEYQKAYELSEEEDYLLMEGRVLLMNRQIQQGYECLRAIKDQSLLEKAGIHLQDLESRWPFINVRGFHFRNQLR